MPRIRTKYSLSVGLILLLGALGFKESVRLVAADNSDNTCSALQVSAGQFINYEKADYNNGLLNLHFKLITGLNGGGFVDNGLILQKPDCNNSETFSAKPTIVPRPQLKNIGIHFTSPTHFQVWDDEQDIAQNCDGCSVDIPATLNAGTEYSTIRFYFRSVNDFLYSGSYPIEQNYIPKEPILIVPGILGTELDDINAGPIWPNLPKLLVSDDSFMDTLEYRDNVSPTYGFVKVGNVLGKISYLFGDFHYSDTMINELNNGGYQLNKNLFLFPYDWRGSIGDLRDQLKNKIQDVFKGTGALKINIVAHSYGGLLVEDYLKNSDGTNIDHIVMVGVPNLGSALAAKALIFGDNLNIPLLNPSEILKISQNMPSIYELLPSSEYFKHIAGYYDDLTNVKQPNLLGYEQSKNLLIDLGKNPMLLNQSEADRANPLDFSNKPYKVYNVVGCGVFTLKTINKMYDSDPGLLERLRLGPKYRIYGDSGDGTVLQKSAEFLTGAKNYYVIGVPHAQLLANDKSRSDIISLAVTGSASVLNGSDTGCSVSGKLLSFSSGVSFEITDRVTGKILKPDLNYTVTKTGEDQHVFLSTQDAKKYQVAVKPAKPEITAASISVSAININQSIVHNYDFQIGTQNINLNTDSASDQLTETDSGGGSTVIPPRDTLDQNYNSIPDPQSTGSSDSLITQTSLPQNLNAVSSVPPAPVVNAPASNEISQPSEPVDQPADLPKDDSNSAVAVSATQDADTSDNNSGQSTDGSGISENDSANSIKPIQLTLNEPTPKIVYINRTDTASAVKADSKDNLTSIPSGNTYIENFNTGSNSDFFLRIFRAITQLLFF